MKCPKCNYTSFDYNQVCPKCGNDNSDVQDQLKFSSNKPNPPFFLASLLEPGTSADPKTSLGAAHSASYGNLYGDLDSEDLLIALEDLDGDGSVPDPPESKAASTNEIDFEKGNSGDDNRIPVETGEDEILFDLDSDAGVDEIENLHGDPLDKEAFMDIPTDDHHGPASQEAATIPSEDPRSTKATVAEPDDDELGLFLDDDTGDSKMVPPKTGAEDEILFELDEPDDLADGKDMSNEIVFELEEAPDEGSKPPDNIANDKKGFWNSDEINKEVLLNDLEEIESETTGADQPVAFDEEKEAALFSDLDVEPLDLELSLDDMEKKPE